MEDYLFLCNKLYGLDIHAFVLMPNHFHLIASAAAGNISESLNHFMRETSKEISKLSGRINQTYGSRNHKSLITNHHHFTNVYKYVYRNPVRAKLVSTVEEWPYSTVTGLLGLRKLSIPVVEDTLMFPEQFDESNLTWLNTTPETAHEDEIRKALRKAKFCLPKFKRQDSVLETWRI